MRTFRVVGNSPACAFLSGRLQEAGNRVEWWTSGFFPRLRSVKIRSESFELLTGYFRRSGADRSFLYSSPGARAWGSLRDGGDVVQCFDAADVEFEDRFIDGAALFNNLKQLAVNRGVQIREFAASIGNPLQDLNDSSLLITDVGISETRLWPRMAPRRPLLDENFIHTQCVWFPVVHSLPESSAPNGISFAEWSGVQMMLEPHAERGMLLTLSSPSDYLLKKSLRDVLNPKVAGLTEIRALFLLNSRQTGSDQVKFKVGKNPYELSIAMKLGSSVGTFHPMSNLQDDFALRSAERFLLYCNQNQALFESRSQLSWASSWNEQSEKLFKSEFSRSEFWRKMMFSKHWGRMVLKASGYLPKSLREKFQSPA